MRRTLLLLASMGLAVLLATGVALAANIKGDENNNVLTGTSSRDTIIPFGGNDTVYALGGNDDVRHSYGNDYIFGGSGDDTLRGGFGNDVIWGGPDKDLIDCAYLESRDKGEAYDTAYASRADRDVVVDCKTVHWDQDTTINMTRIQSIDPDKPDQPTLTR
jgi:RTX calcium-binding nonapeptide repeat (4 copies)